MTSSVYSQAASGQLKKAAHIYSSATTDQTIDIDSNLCDGIIFLYPPASTSCNITLNMPSVALNGFYLRVICAGTFSGSTGQVQINFGSAGVAGMIIGATEQLVNTNQYIRTNANSAAEFASAGDRVDIECNGANWFAQGFSGSATNSGWSFTNTALA